METESFRGYVVRRTESKDVVSSIEDITTADLPPGDVLIRVHYSALNYKDALAATGHPGVARKLPHIPGIDAVGRVVESASKELRPGDEVLVTSFELGSGQWGAWAEFIRVPAEWVIPLPEKLSPEDAIIYGTAGLTAGPGVEILQHHGVTPEGGEVVVTGATGGVGTMAVRLLAGLGYQVAAVSGKKERESWLRDLGAARVLPREKMIDTSDRPLLSATWAGAIDTVGSVMLATILRSTKLGGCVAACGLVGGADLPTTVYPFILRGVTLAGIDSGWISRERRTEVWRKLAGEWKVKHLGSIAEHIPLAKVEEYVPEILAGKIAGRIVVDVAG
jgi:putative YhdH/YhfP family quinone oxidoreductase